jgi:hypothetical protein
VFCSNPLSATVTTSKSELRTLKAFWIGVCTNKMLVAHWKQCRDNLMEISNIFSLNCLNILQIENHHKYRLDTLYHKMIHLFLNYWRFFKQSFLIVADSDLFIERTCYALGSWSNVGLIENTYKTPTEIQFKPARVILQVSIFTRSGLTSFNDLEISYCFVDYT